MWRLWVSRLPTLVAKCQAYLLQTACALTIPAWTRTPHIFFGLACALRTGGLSPRHLMEPNLWAEDNRDSMATMAHTIPQSHEQLPPLREVGAILVDYSDR